MTGQGRDLEAFFGPSSIAVVGAGERLTSSGGAVLRNLGNSGYGGQVIPVNPKGGTILGLQAKTSLRELDTPADLAVVVVRPDLITEVARDAAASGHKNLLILPGGFSEAGPEGVAREKELLALAAESGITIAGPNCAGLIHLRPEFPFAATFLRDMPPGGGLAFVSQSGAIAEELIAAANDRKLPLGTVVSVGNGIQLGVEEYLDYLGSQADVSCILLYIESVADPERFRHIARRVAREKPIVALIGGRTAQGGMAARNHTGSAAMTDEDADTFCRDCGMIRVRSLRRLMLAAKGFGFYPHGIGSRALLMSNSGGPGVIATDRIRDEGLDMPPLPNAMAARLEENLPYEAAVANPIDLLADAREERFGMALDTAIEIAADGFDAFLMIHVVPFMVDPVPVVQALAAKARSVPVPLFHSMMGTLPGKADLFATMEAEGVPMFNDVEEMAECAGILSRYPAIRQSL